VDDLASRRSPLYDLHQLAASDLLRNDHLR